MSMRQELEPYAPPRPKKERAQPGTNKYIGYGLREENFEHRLSASEHDLIRPAGGNPRARNILLECGFVCNVYFSKSLPTCGGDTLERKSTRLNSSHLR